MKIEFQNSVVRLSFFVLYNGHQNCLDKFPSFREVNLVLQLIQESQIKSKTMMSWSLQKGKEGIFCTVYLL